MTKLHIIFQAIRSFQQRLWLGYDDDHSCNLHTSWKNHGQFMMIITIMMSSDQKLQNIHKKDHDEAGIIITTMIFLGQVRKSE